MPKPKAPVQLVRLSASGEVKTLDFPTTKRILLAFYADAKDSDYITARLKKIK